MKTAKKNVDSNKYITSSFLGLRDTSVSRNVRYNDLLYYKYHPTKSANIVDNLLVHNGKITWLFDFALEKEN